MLVFQAGSHVDVQKCKCQTSTQNIAKDRRFLVIEFRISTPKINGYLLGAEWNFANLLGHQVQQRRELKAKSCWRGLENPDDTLMYDQVVLC